jgi:dihydroflavonol-4-reductase
VSRKILVTGATGFIGSRLVRKLLSGGDEVYALVRKSSNLELFSDVAGKVHIVEGDITNVDSLQDAFEGMDQVYHSAGYTYMGGSNGKVGLLRSINVDGTRNVMQAALNKQVGRVVHVSSITAVGISKKNDPPCNESSEWNFDKVGLYYAETKRQAEIEVRKAVEKGLDCVIVNPAYVFGAGDVNFNAGRLIKDAYHKKMPFYPLGGVCVVDVEIVVEAVVRAMEVGRTGERYILGGDNVTYKELANIISRVTGRPMFMVPLPFFVTKFLHALLVMLHFKNRVSKLFNPTMFRVASEFLYFSSEKAIRELDMRTEPIEHSIRRAFNWYKEEGLL